MSIKAIDLLLEFGIIDQFKTGLQALTPYDVLSEDYFKFINEIEKHFENSDWSFN